MKSSTFTVPCSLIDWAVTVVTGLAVVRFGCGMRDPVTTTSPTVVPWSAVCA